MSERKQVEEHLQYLATHDYLTSIPNRYYLEDTLQEVILEATAATPGALLFVDLDNFKVINDTFGHAEGDKVLILFANKIKQMVRKGDFIARLNGDEFAIIMEDTNLNEAKVIAERFFDRNTK
nr:GGDEF domain-containing protein [Desulforamulus aquiferis]